MILRLTLRDPGRRSSYDIEVTAEPRSSIESLLGALPGVGGRPCFVGTEPLDPLDSVEDSALISGAIISVGTPGPATRAAPGSSVATVRVIAGPDAGLSFVLAPGEIVVGRGGRARVRLRDQTVSRHHFSLLLGAGGVTLCDLDSANGTWIGERRINSPEPLAPGTRITAGDDVMEIVPVSGPALAVTRSADARLEFDRAFAPAPVISAAEISLPPVPVAGGSGLRAMITAAAAPIVLGAAMAALLKNVAMLAFAAFAPLSAVISYVVERGQRRRREREYRAACAAADQQIRTAVDAEQRLRHELAPDTTAITLTATGATRGLWPRNIDSPDGLTLSVGKADRPASVKLIGGQPWKDFRAPMLAGVPVTVDLRTTGVLGVVGSPGDTEALTNWLVVQLATLRSPDDLRIVVIAPDGRPELAWTRWLPHTDAGQDSDVPCWIGNSPGTRAARVEELKELIARRQDAQRERASIRFEDEVVVILQGALAGRTTPGMRELLREGYEVGVYCICVDERDMNECRGVVQLTGGELVLRRQRHENAQTARGQGIPANEAEVLARALAPMRDRLTQRGAAGAIPYPLRFLDLLDVTRVRPADILGRWANVDGPTLRVPLGADARGTVDVDLARQGPHTMLAGATGAGKSILLQTLVTSLLLANRPDELNLVLVDFKGGSAFLPFEHCPHVVALIRSTDDDPAQKFDEAAAARVLTSIRAEVRYREALLARYGGEIDVYWNERQRRPDLPPLPRLVMIFDEFARAIEVSQDFPKELVNVAGKGRSLGMHLVLATQSMQAKLSPEMKNNISLRITLRQNERADSMEVLGVPDAVGIPGRLHGRGMILCTKEESRIPRTFQSGYLGDPPPSGAASPARVRLLDWTVIGAQRPTPEERRGAEVTDQKLAITAVEAASAQLQLPPPRRPLLPPLPALLPEADLPGMITSPPAATALLFGLVDDPETQHQRAAVLDLAGTERLMIAGGPQQGRTSAARALVASLVERFGPDQAHVYVVAEKPGPYRDYESITHCGGVFSPADPERVRRLVMWLHDELQRRSRHQFSDVDQPAILVVVDGWECLENRGAGIFDETSLLERLREIVADGPPLRMHIVALGGAPMLTSRLPDTFSRRVLLSFPEERTRRAHLAQGWPSPVPIPGRGIEASSGLHLQIVADNRTVAELRPATRQSFSAGKLPHRFPVLPEAITLAELRIPPPRPSATWIPLGVGGPEVSTVGVDLFGADPHLLLISGPGGSGRSSAASSIAASLAAAGVGVLVVGPPSSPVHASLPPGAVSLTSTTLRDSDLRAAAEGLGRPLTAIVVDDFEQIRVLPSQVNFMDGPTLLEEYADAGSAGRHALVLCGNGGPVLDGTLRNPVMERVGPRMVAGGSRVALMPASVFVGKVLGLVLEHDQLSAGRVGLGQAAIGRTRLALQLAQINR